MATLYYDDMTGNLSDADNYWLDDSAGTPAGRVPTAEDDVIFIWGSPSTGSMVADHVSLQGSAYVMGGTINCNSLHVQTGFTNGSWTVAGFVDIETGGQILDGTLVAETITSLGAFDGPVEITADTISIGNIINGGYCATATLNAAVTVGQSTVTGAEINGSLVARYECNITGGTSVNGPTTVEGATLDGAVFNDDVSALGLLYLVISNTFHADLALATNSFDPAAQTGDYAAHANVLNGRLSIDGGETFSEAPADYTVNASTGEITINNYPILRPPHSPGGRGTPLMAARFRHIPRF